MLCPNSIGASVAAIAILCASAINNNALAGTFANGDFITYRQAEWGDAPVLATPHPFAAVYPSGLLLGVVGVPGLYSIGLTAGPAVLNYLPTGGPNVPFTFHGSDPTFPLGGQFTGELTALHLNIDFSDEGLLSGALGIPFGDLTLTNLVGLPGLEGVSVRYFASIANYAIAGGATGFNLDDLTLICAELNVSFLPGPDLFGPTAWAQEHLRIACPADINHSNAVNVDDLLAVITAWGPGRGPADLDHNGVVNVNDLLAVITVWGPCPGVPVNDRCSTPSNIGAGNTTVIGTIHWPRMTACPHPRRATSSATPTSRATSGSSGPQARMPMA